MQVSIKLDSLTEKEIANLVKEKVKTFLRNTDEVKAIVREIVEEESAKELNKMLSSIDKQFIIDQAIRRSMPTQGHIDTVVVTGIARKLNELFAPEIEQRNKKTILNLLKNEIADLKQYSDYDSSLATTSNREGD